MPSSARQQGVDVVSDGHLQHRIDFGFRHLVHTRVERPTDFALGSPICSWRHEVVVGCDRDSGSHSDTLSMPWALAKGVVALNVSEEGVAVGAAIFHKALRLRNLASTPELFCVCVLLDLASHEALQVCVEPRPAADRVRNTRLVAKDSNVIG